MTCRDPGCNCHYTVDSGSVNQWGQGKNPCCGNLGDIGQSSTFDRLACAYAIVFGCEHPWWKHIVPTSLGPQPMLLPSGQYSDDTFTSEPSATYKATFLGKICDADTGYCQYVQYEGTGAWSPSHPQCQKEFSLEYERGCASLYHRCCDLQNYRDDSTTGRDPYYLDPVTGAITYAPMIFDLRNNNDQLRALFGGTDDDCPYCCWLNIVDDRNCGTCINTWQGWTLHLDQGDVGPYFRPSPRLTYQEGNEAFWNAVGRPEPWYGWDSSFAAEFSPWANGANQFTLQNAEYWPSLPASVCVHPVRWPYFDSPCEGSKFEETCPSCTPPKCGRMCVSFATCPDGDGTLSGSMTSYSCPSFDDSLCPSSLELNATLPTGVTAAGDCGYWWKSFPMGSDTSCDSPPAIYYIGVMTYWDGTSWQVDFYCSDDDVTFSGPYAATVSNQECTCNGPTFDFTVTGVTCVCCCCEGCSDEATFSTDGPGGSWSTPVLAADECVFSIEGDFGDPVESVQVQIGLKCGAVGISGISSPCGEWTLVSYTINSCDPLDADIVFECGGTEYHASIVA